MTNLSFICALISAAACVGCLLHGVWWPAFFNFLICLYNVAVVAALSSKEERR